MFKTSKSKKILGATLAAAFALSVGGTVLAADGDQLKKDRYEAETGSLKGIDIKVVPSTLASGGKKVGWINVPGKDGVTFTVKVTTAGEYIIEEGYDNGMGNAKHSIIVNGKKYIAKLPSTGSWDDYAVSDGVRVSLNAGDNKVVVTANTAFAELDYIDVYLAPADSE